MNKIPTNVKPVASTAHLQHSKVLHVHGADALGFLQGQLSQDIANIETGAASIAGLSNPKGRLLAICHVYKVQNDEFWLVLPDSMRESVQTHLKKYVMRSKVQIDQREDLFIYGFWGGAHIECEHRYQVSKHSDLFIGIQAQALPELGLADETNWNQQKVLNGIPDVFPNTQEHFVAQMLNLDLLNGISFSKGCYTGQEIIARMQHLGRIKRRMLLIELENAPAIGEKLIIEEQSLGEVVNMTNFGQKSLVLACIQLDKLHTISARLQTKTMKYSIPEIL